jgi:hypothetical protein
MARSDLTAARLRELLHYDWTTGLFVRKVGCQNDIKPGDVAGSRTSKGYVRIKVCRVMHMAHRLAWLYMHGEWPVGQIDHINGVPSDNCLANLRDVSQSVNLHNISRARKGNRSGLLGVSQHSGSRRWQARINVNGRHFHIGTFDTIAEAHAAYLAEKSPLRP